MDLDDHIGFFIFAAADIVAMVSCAVALTWAAVRDGRTVSRAGGDPGRAA